MKKFFALYVIILIGYTTTLAGNEVYKPYPILFVHGIGGSASDWDASIKPTEDGGSSGNLFYYFHRPDRYGSQSYLEAFSITNPVESIDTLGAGGNGNYWGGEVTDWIKNTLKKYYGDDWESNPDAKLILVAHSMGGLGAREAFRTHNPNRGLL